MTIQDHNIFIYGCAGALFGVLIFLMGFQLGAEVTSDRCVAGLKRIQEKIEMMDLNR